MKIWIAVDTDNFKNMTVSELRKFTLDYYNTYLKGKKATIEKVLKEVVFTTQGGRKIAKGGNMYTEKAAVVEHLETLIKNSTYNNWGERKPKDAPNVLGYMNFKAKLIIDGEKRHVRIAIVLKEKGETEFKNIEVGKKSKPTKKGTLP